MQLAVDCQTHPLTLSPGSIIDGWFSVVNVDQPFSYRFIVDITFTFQHTQSILTNYEKICITRSIGLVNNEKECLSKKIEQCKSCFYSFLLFFFGPFSHFSKLDLAWTLIFAHTNNNILEFVLFEFS